MAMDTMGMSPQLTADLQFTTLIDRLTKLRDGYLASRGGWFLTYYQATREELECIGPENVTSLLATIAMYGWELRCPWGVGGAMLVCDLKAWAARSTQAPGT